MPKAVSFEQSIEIDIDNDGALQLKCHPQFSKELGKFAREIAELARIIVNKEHRISGKLGRSIQPYKGRSANVRREGPHRLAASVTAGSTRAPYARYVHEGNAPHEIWARKPGGKLSFRGSGKQGRKTFKVTTKKLLPDELLSPGGREDRNRKGRGPRRRLRYADRDVYTEDVEHTYAERNVVIDHVNHPGYSGHRFLNEAAVVVARRYAGIGPSNIKLPRGSFRGPF